jgi:hypothetical protein
MNPLRARKMSDEPLARERKPIEHMRARLEALVRLLYSIL